MKELYRLIDGEFILNETLRDKIQFGFVYEDEGKIIMEVYFPAGNGNIFFSLWHSSNQITTDQLRIEAITDKNYEIVASRLFPTSVSRGNVTKGKFVCQSIVEVTKPISQHQLEVRKELPKKEQNVYVIELEGLQLEHTDVSVVEKPHETSFKYWDTLNLENDFSTFSVGLSHNGAISTYSGEIRNHPIKDSKNLVLTFEPVVSRAIWDENEKYILQVLSFANGGVVGIRKLHTGHNISYSTKHFESQRTEFGSFTSVSSQLLSDFIPINHRFGSDNSELRTLFKLYSKFVEESKKLDFHSLIYYLNAASNNTNIEQQVFTLIVALEELGSNYLREYNPRPEYIVDGTTFDGLKSELLSTFDTFRGKLPEKAFYDLRSRLCGINYRRIDTNEKFFKLFEHAGIQRSENIENLVSQRHKAIHEGQIGKTIEDKRSFYYHLDHLLRKILMNRIGYTGPVKPHRNVFPEWFKKDEKPNKGKSGRID